jgi:hypothetical protein
VVGDVCCSGLNLLFVVWSAVWFLIAGLAAEALKFLQGMQLACRSVSCIGHVAKALELCWPSFGHIGDLQACFAVAGQHMPVFLQALSWLG